ncbi:MAG: hypothetical protein NDF54_07365 [archaeon GB-1867-035]|nr:hypothetical protein [Candidatus Culexmicrobium profundum]
MVEWGRVLEIAVPVGVGLFVLALVLGGVRGGVPTGKSISISNIIIQ